MSTNTAVVIAVGALILLLALLIVAFLVRVLKRTFGAGAGEAGKRFGNAKTSNKVKITEQGRSGNIQYSEKGNTCDFYWEFGGGNTIVMVWVPQEDKWDAKYPWAKGRRKEIAEFTAEEVRRAKAPSSKIKWEKQGFNLVKG